MNDLEALRFRDPVRARALVDALGHHVRRAARPPDRPLAVMHVCGSHEQAIARFGLRATFPEGLEVIMGPASPATSPSASRGLASAPPVSTTVGPPSRAAASATIAAVAATIVSWKRAAIVADGTPCSRSRTTARTIGRRSISRW